MSRRSHQLKLRQNVVTSDSDSDSDTDASNDNTSQRQSASDVINSFLKRNKTVEQEVNVPKFRSASDVISSFLQTNKTVKQANKSQFQSALDVINSYLRKDKTVEDKATTGQKSSRKRKNGRANESTSDSDSSVAKKRKVESSSNTSRNTRETSHDKLIRHVDSILSRGTSRFSNPPNRSKIPTTNYHQPASSTSCNLLEEIVQIDESHHQQFAPSTSNRIPASSTSDTNLSKENVQPNENHHQQDIPSTSDRMPTSSTSCDIDLLKENVQPNENSQHVQQGISSVSNQMRVTSTSCHTNLLEENVQIDENHHQQDTPLTPNRMSAPSTSCNTNLLQENVQTDEISLYGPRPRYARSNRAPLPNRNIMRHKTTDRIMSQSEYRRLNGITYEPPKSTPNEKVQQLRALLKREAPDKTDPTKTIVDYEIVSIKECQIPIMKYDRAFAILNSEESRFDETPINYNIPSRTHDIRKNCEYRRLNEATYNTYKLGKAKPISFSRILREMDNCLKREDWKEMAELIYLGCDIMKTDESRRGCGTTFFTYALLLLLLDTNRNSDTSLDDKKNTVVKYLKALGNEEDEINQFLKDLNLITKDVGTISTVDSQVVPSEAD